MHASPPVDSQHNDTYFVIAHFHYVLFGGSVFGIFSALYFWFPKFSGRMLGETLGKIHFWLMLIGFNLTFFPQHFLGVDGMARRTWTYGPEQGFSGWFGNPALGWNLVSTIGAYTMAISILTFIVNVVVALRKPKTAPADPWDGGTLEWAISSPPPPYNFGSQPVVYGRDPLWMEKFTAQGIAEHGSELPPGAVGVAQAEIEAHADGRDPGAHIHMPGQSFFPFITAAGLALMAVGMLCDWSKFAGTQFSVITIMGIAWILIGIFGWTQEPV
jgi:cytochrome c oxidase subunit 1